MAEKLEAGSRAMALLQGDNARMVEALRFYAKPSNWSIYRISYGKRFTQATDDSGELARAALNSKDLYTATPDRSDDALAEENRRLREALVAAKDNALHGEIGKLRQAIVTGINAALQGDGL